LFFVAIPMMACAADDCKLVSFDEVKQALPELTAWKPPQSADVGNCQFITDPLKGMNLLVFNTSVNPSKEYADREFASHRDDHARDAVPELAGLGDRAYLSQYYPGGMEIMAQKDGQILQISVNFKDPIKPSQISAIAKLGQTVLLSYAELYAKKQKAKQDQEAGEDR